MYPLDRLSHNWLAKLLVNCAVVPQIGKFRGMVLDLGCGLRPFEPEVRAVGADYIGLDWASSLHGMSADICADLNRPLPILDESIDHVMCIEVLEHVAEFQLLLCEAMRILRPGGSILITTPFQWWVHESPWDYQRLTVHGLEYHLAKAGFNMIEIKPTSGFWAMICLKLNYQSARLARWLPFPKFSRMLMIPAWYVAQRLAPVADAVWKEHRETVGYVSVAVKHG